MTTVTHRPDELTARDHLHPSAREAGAVLYTMEARLTTSVPIGLLPGGIRIDNTFEGAITSGELAGARVHGIDYYLIRPDGVGVIDARETIVGPDYAVAATARGYVLPPEGMQVPPLEQLLDPQFPWPDEPFPLRVAQTFRTAAPQLDHLNRLVVAHLGGVNYATRTISVDAYRIEPGMIVAAPTEELRWAPTPRTTHPRDSNESNESNESNPDSTATSTSP